MALREISRIRSRSGAIWRAISALALCIGAVLFGDPSTIPIAQAVNQGAAGALTAVVPCRLADTRINGALWIDASRIRISATGQCGIPAGATAAAITVTATRPTGAGWLTAYPAGATQPVASTLNFATGETRANGALILLSSTGQIDVFASARADIIVDVTGYFSPAIFGVERAGRYVALTPARLLDTRIGGAKMLPGSTLTVSLPAFVPTDAIALALNVTTTETTGEGFFTAYLPGGQRPNASMLNADGPNQTRAAGFVGTINAAGISIFSSSGGHLIVDVAGYFTGASGTWSSSGLFVPIDPTRILDTRVASGALAAGQSIDLVPNALAATTVAAVAANWTLTEGAPGYLSTHPSGFARAETSTVNADTAFQTVANLGITPVSAQGTTAFSSSPTHLVVDVYGWFTGPSFTPGLVIAAVGDMVCAPGQPTTTGDCHEQQVSDLIAADNSISAFLALGDLQYENGELANFNSEYHPTYGRFLPMTFPVPGNREYNTPNATGYYDYFGSRAGDRSRGYYSFNLGNWHVVALNSNCSFVSCATFSLQEQWLRADLAANSRPCILAFWHHPIFTSADPETPSPARVPLWQALQDFGADVVLNGHQHVYERFGRQLVSGAASPNGIRQFVVGTGGDSVAPIGSVRANSEVRIPRTFGLLKMNLSDSGYSWSFVREDSTILDSGSDQCLP